MATQEDRIMMRDGKVMLVRNGDRKPLEHEMTLPNGTHVMPSGQVVMADGSAHRLSEGEAIDLNGEMIDMDPAHMSDRRFKEEMEDEELRDDIEGE